MRKLYARAEYWEALTPWEQALHCMRTLQQLHPEWVYLGFSAALVHGLEVPQDCLWPLWVATERNKGTYSTPQIMKRICEDRQSVLINNLRATTLERTILDCLSVLSFSDGLAMADSALKVSGLTREELRARIEGLRGFSNGDRPVLETVLHADGRARTGAESRARGMAIELGFVPPLVNAGHEGSLGWQLDGRLVLMPVEQEITDREAFAHELAKLGVPRVDKRGARRDPLS